MILLQLISGCKGNYKIGRKNLNRLLNHPQSFKLLVKSVINN